MSLHAPGCPCPTCRIPQPTGHAAPANPPTDWREKYMTLAEAHERLSANRDQLKRDVDYWKGKAAAEQASKADLLKKLEGDIAAPTNTTTVKV